MKIVVLTSIMLPVLASAIWSLTPAVVSRYAKNVDPAFFTALRAGAALIVIAPISLSNGIRFNYGLTHYMFLVVFSALIGPCLGDTLYTKAIQRIGGSLAVVISYTYIFVSQFFSVILLQEYLSIWIALGSIFAFLGVALAVLDSKIDGINLGGVLYSLGAALSWGFATVLIKFAQPYVDVLTMATIRLLIVFLALAPIGITSRSRIRISYGVVLALLVSGVLGWGVGMYLYIYSIYTLGVSSTVLATSLTPILSQITTKFIAREKPSAKVILGAILTSAGITLQILP